jgi:hypothetical protein
MRLSGSYLVLILSVVSIATCRSAGAKRPMQNSSPTLSVTKAKVQDSALQLSYRVVNPSDHPIYLVARLFRRSAAGFATDPNLVYTEVKNGALQLTKAMIPVPDHIDVEVPEVPYVVKVEAGKAFDETLQVPVPVEPLHPYAGVKRVAEAHSFAKVELVIGWLADDGVKVDHVTRAGQPAELQIHHQTVATKQHLLTAAVGVAVPARIAAP